MADGDMGAGEREVQEKTEATMKRGRIMTRAILLLIVIGLSLSACAVQPGGYVYDGYPYYNTPRSSRLISAPTDRPADEGGCGPGR
jgi:hypothetical protein